MIHISLGFAVCLAATAPAEIKIAATSLRALDVSPQRAAFFSEHLATSLAARGLRVVSEREIATMLGLERQRELLGCSDETTNCTAELANALGVDAVLIGDLARIGSRLQVNLKVLDAKKGTPLSIRTFRVDSDEALLDALGTAASEMSAEVVASFENPSAAVNAQGLTPRSVLPVPARAWPAPAAIAAATGIISGVCFGFSQANYQRLDPTAPTGSVSLVEANQAASRGAGLQWAGAAMAGVAIVALVATVVIVLLGNR